MNGLIRFLLAIQCFAAVSAWALNPSFSPAGNFVLTTWSIQLPINANGGLSGGAYEVPPSDLNATAYTNPASGSYCGGQVTNYFYTGADGAMIFWAPDQGATTSGSTHTRSELSQLGYSWFLRGTHTLNVQCKVLQTNSDTGKVCIGQIKGFSPNMTCVMLFYVTGLIQAMVHTNADDTGTVYYNFGTVALSNSFNYTLQAVDGVVTVAANGITNSWNLLQSDPGYATNSLYFKAGSYNQSTLASTSDGARVAFYSLSSFNGPNITNQPASLAVNLGDNATFSVAASGNGNKQYQWWLNATNILAGKTSSSLTINSVFSTNLGNYNVVVNDSYGSVTSSIARLTTNAAPEITSQPISQTVWLGDAATFNVGVFGNKPLTYRWLLNSTNGVGLNTNVLTIPGVQSANNGNYTVVVSNAYGAVTSSVANLTVTTSGTNIFNLSDTWTCPANVTSIRLECWGGGGAGGSALRTPNSASVQYGGGGAGGAYARLVSYPVTPGNIYYVNVGTGGVAATGTLTNGVTFSGGSSWFNSVNIEPSGTGNCLAKGGAGGACAVGNTSTTAFGAGGVGTTNGSLGDVVFAGGSGAAAPSSSPTYGGAGGGSGGTNSTGYSGTPNSGTGAAAVAGGAPGGNPNATSGSSGPGQIPVFGPGGGGGGARATTQQTGGNGAAGQVTISYTAILPLAANFMATPLTGGAPLDVTFTDTSTGTITNRIWNFGDGTTTNTSATSLIHSYRFPGTNTVRLIVSDTSGSSTNRQTNLIAAVSVDSIGDGIPDWWRAQFFGGNGTTTNSSNCATGDFDQDGSSNLAEYLADTVPTNAASKLVFIKLAMGTNGINLTWIGGSNARQYIQRTFNLGDTNGWINLNTNPPPTGITNTLIDIGGSGLSNCFYRIKANR